MDNAVDVTSSIGIDSSKYWICLFTNHGIVSTVILFERDDSFGRYN